MNDITNSNGESGHSSRDAYLEKLHSLQETPFADSLQDREQTRLIMCETNLFCRDILKHKGRKVDDVPTYGEYLAYLKYKILVKKDPDIINTPTDQTGFVHSKIIESTLNLLTQKKEADPQPSDAMLASQLTRGPEDQFRYVKGALKKRRDEESRTLELVKDYGRQPRDHLPTDPEELRKLGADTYERMIKDNSKARQEKVVTLKARGLTLDEIDFILNGRKRKPLREEPRILAIADGLPMNHVFTDFLADTVEKDAPGYHPVTKPLDSDYLDQHQSIIDRLKGHLDVLTTIQSRYNEIFINGRPGGITH